MTIASHTTARHARRKTALALLVAMVAAGGAFASTTQTTGKGNTASGQEKKAFTIAGGAASPVAPGTAAPLNLVLSNPNNQAILVAELSVAIARTSRAQCDAATNFTVRQIPASRYPITLPAGGSHRLSGLGVASGDLPRIVGLNSRSIDQDACKGATLELRYAGRAVK